jgi:methylated-DNA-[protein]-cysteine S-methyltransferase
MSLFSSTFHSPIGQLQIIATPAAVLQILFPHQHLHIVDRPNEITALAQEQLELYFQNKLRLFTVPVSPQGTDFQLQVWEALQDIRYGRILSYAAFAKAMGSEPSIRAIANANGKNLIPILIPCHRVIGSNGKLVGYSGGLEVKKYLLQLEGSIARELF